MKFIPILGILLLLSKVIFSQEKSRSLNVPKRTNNAIGATEFVTKAFGLNSEDREKIIIKEVANGNVPSFSRLLKPFRALDSAGNELIFFATVDYLAIGSDEDFIYMPMTPLAAQALANQLDCLLPTQKMVDLIYAQAGAKLRPQPIPPSDKMTTVPVFWQHTDSIKLQMAEIGFKSLAQKSVAGHKKDIICSNKIFDKNGNSGKVVIYGWHRNENEPIQPVYAGHSDSYADYSHGVRFISKVAFLNGVAKNMTTILKDESLCKLISYEGIIERSYYPID